MKVSPVFKKSFRKNEPERDEVNSIGTVLSNVISMGDFDKTEKGPGIIKYLNN